MTNKQKVQCVEDRSSQSLVSQESSAWNYETLHCQTSTLEMRRLQMLQCHLLEVSLVQLVLLESPACNLVIQYGHSCAQLVLWVLVQ